MSLFWICSLMKWCLISICFDLEYWIEFLVRFIALVLSHLMGVSLSLIPKSLSCCLIHKIWAQQLPAVMYSASAVDSATEFCFLLNHEIRLTPKNWQVPLVLFLSNLHPAKSVSEYPNKSIYESLEYHNPRVWVPFKYLRILLTAFKWDSLGLDWYLAHKQTLNMISGLLAVRYNNEPIIPL